MISKKLSRIIPKLELVLFIFQEIRKSRCSVKHKLNVATDEIIHLLYYIEEEYFF